MYTTLSVLGLAHISHEVSWITSYGHTQVYSIVEEESKSVKYREMRNCSDSKDNESNAIFHPQERKRGISSEIRKGMSRKLR